MVYNEIAKDLKLNPQSWTAAIMFSTFIGILSIGITFVLDILVYQELHIVRTLVAGIALIVILALVVRATLVLRKQEAQHTTPLANKSGKMALSSKKHGKHRR